MRALPCSYTSAAFRRVRKVQRLATEATQAVGQRRFEDATESWTGAVEAAELPAHAPLTAVLHSERANSLLRSQQCVIAHFYAFPSIIADDNLPCMSHSVMHLTSVHVCQSLSVVINIWPP